MGLIIGFGAGPGFFSARVGEVTGGFFPGLKLS